MTYYPDLTPYQYTLADQPMVNVGWLEPGHEFIAAVLTPLRASA
nr:hypothetical protein [Kibdelosporangium sp. MJ126-NF4]CEL21843.1 hypothetical protein [Kibdelosporangium sp. MJ126-NF4]CTQ92622.1 hypothetical protein [Kibdelosporangium sp. MJ126-NF4]